ncbi:MAG TPA: type IV pilus twitching motility protein PilT [Myxococcaceae bacterium]|nr:type IV pilus twitching motility protein PilT [Myxococcaceae bacterium]
MPRLDPVIDKLFKEAGTELVIETGSGAFVRTQIGLSAVIKQPLSTPQIIGAFSEIVPDDMRSGFPGPGITNFPYASPAGPVMIRFENGGKSVKVQVTPYLPAGGMPSASASSSGDEGETLELASPSEMLELAQQQVSGFRPAPTPIPPRPAASAPAPTPFRGVSAAKPVAAPPAPAAAPTPKKEVPLAVGAIQIQRAAQVEFQPSSDAKVEMERLLETMLKRRASDLHLSSSNPPNFRIDGDMVPDPEYGVVSPERLKDLVFSIAPEKNRKQWEEIKDTDFAHETEGARFRVNVFCDRKGIGAVMRQIPNNIKTAEEMGLSKHIMDLCFLSKGLVLVTGPTGSGKSTTLAAMIDYINRNREDHIITIEDPIEFVHPNKKCLVNQREIGVHTSSFKHALRAALREDPDIVLVGEMRDLETIAIAIETAETGHLVFGTLHTNTAASTVDRIIDQFPADRQGQIRMMLSESLKGVISQTLCKKIGGGRVAAQEVLLCTGSVSNLIREGKTFQIPSIMQTGRGQGMVTLNDALYELVRKKQVDPKDAYIKAVAKTEFKSMLERGGYKVDLTE